MKKILEHEHRLPRERYVGRTIIAFTICVFGKERLFIEENIFSSIEKILLNSLRTHRCEAYVYLFMLDHIHLLLEGRTDKSDLWRCVVDFKQRSGYWLSRNKIKEKWQKDFYDHILRKDEDVVKQVRYILDNPVRKGIVNNWKDYRFKGSTIYNFEEW